MDKIPGSAFQRHFSAVGPADSPHIRAACQNNFVENKFADGIALLNTGKYYQAHDVLEEVWREVHGWNKPFYQGMVQIAISMHHFSTGNLAGAKSVLRKARTNLGEYPASFCGIELAELRAQLDSWQQAMDSGAPTPSPVRVQLSPEC